MSSTCPCDRRFRDKLQPSSSILWETPIAHVIPRSPTATAFGDSCLKGAGGYSTKLGFWWHIDFPEEIKRRTLRFKSDNKDGQLISINVHKLVTVIINYIASLHVITRTNFTDDPHPVLLNVTDNMLALKWTTLLLATDKLTPWYQLPMDHYPCE